MQTHMHTHTSTHREGNVLGTLSNSGILKLVIQKVCGIGCFVLFFFPYFGRNLKRQFQVVKWICLVSMTRTPTPRGSLLNQALNYVLCLSVCVYSCIYICCIMENLSLRGGGGENTRMSTLFCHTILVSAWESFAEGVRGESSC